MKRHLLLAAALLALASPVTAIAAEAPQRDCAEECRLLLKNCKGTADTINDQIRKLDHQLSKESNAYTVEELQKLRAKLEDAKTLLDNLQKK